MTAKPFIAQARIDTPLGPLTAAATAAGLAGLWFDHQAHHPGPLLAPLNPDQAFIAQARAELERYWKQQLPGGFRVALDARGTPFQHAVWRVLRGIAGGQTHSYAQVAALAGSARAVRAAGAAIARNPISIVVPCHRVVGGNGALTGYAGGLARKLALLQLEGALPTLASAA